VTAPLSESKSTNNGTNGPLGASANEEAPKAAAKSAFGNSGPDPFAALNQQDKAKHDFESAFASSDSSNSDAAKAFPSFSTKFPPIQELERVDDSESESDRGGFDDDFVPASPPSKAPEKSDSHKPASPSVIKSSSVSETVKSSGSATEQATMT
jgi:epidermal growth factor receptor substrate 15